MHHFRPLLFLSLMGQAPLNADISKRGSPYSESLHDIGKVKFESFGCAERRSLPASYWKRPPRLHPDFSSTYLAKKKKEIKNWLYLHHRTGNKRWGQKWHWMSEFACYCQQFWTPFGLHSVLFCLAVIA